MSEGYEVTPTGARLEVRRMLGRPEKFSCDREQNEWGALLDGFRIFIWEDKVVVLQVDCMPPILTNFFLQRAIKKTLRLYETMKKFSGPIFVKHG